ncbi:claudin-10-like isoform X1 [Bufo gargarizans]|uniref:claudin-10-like isoform X1 n=1 Tax=Bufo gargarizans TaxID=30331 RepID=UPI001CF2EBE3|nr:claudin-10-like isoform X1 [Bufo gargarizans]
MPHMASEIIAFVLSVSGWVLVSSTLPTDYWKVSSIDGTVITTATFWSNLWKTCVTDSTGVSNCKDFPSMLALEGYIQACRGLLIAAVSLGFFGSIFALVGMKCTKIGGSDDTKAKLTCFSGLLFILSVGVFLPAGPRGRGTWAGLPELPVGTPGDTLAGLIRASLAPGLCAMTGVSLYAHKITSEFFDPSFLEQKYELGAALFIGWAGSSLTVIGGAILCLSLNDSIKKARVSYSYNGAKSVRSAHISRHDQNNNRNGQRGTPRNFDKNAYV